MLACLLPGRDAMKRLMPLCLLACGLAAPAAAVAAGCGYVTDQRAAVPESQDIYQVEITRIDGRSTPLSGKPRYRVEAGRHELTVAERIDPARLPGAAVA